MCISSVLLCWLLWLCQTRSERARGTGLSSNRKAEFLRGYLAGRVLYPVASLGTPTVVPETQYIHLDFRDDVLTSLTYEKKHPTRKEGRKEGKVVGCLQLLARASSADRHPETLTGRSRSLPPGCGFFLAAPEQWTRHRLLGPSERRMRAV